MKVQTEFWTNQYSESITQLLVIYPSVFSSYYLDFYGIPFFSVRKSPGYQLANDMSDSNQLKAHTVLGYQKLGTQVHYRKENPGTLQYIVEIIKTEISITDKKIHINFEINFVQIYALRLLWKHKYKDTMLFLKILPYFPIERLLLLLLLVKLCECLAYFIIDLLIIVN